jgi:nitrite reductase/ring-hydroxylating ferredoxin subunit
MTSANLTSKSILVVLVILLLAGCRREQIGGVPIVPVDISINVNNPSYADLAVTGGWLYLTGGSMGLIVYRRSPSEFTAMDRHCPYKPEDVCRVFVDDTQIIARDTLCCGSAFLITDGSVTQGPAAINMHRYNTTFNGTTLRIYN